MHLKSAHTGDCVLTWRRRWPSGPRPLRAGWLAGEASGLNTSVSLGCSSSERQVREHLGSQVIGARVECPRLCSLFLRKGLETEHESAMV
jgi:hypothetical protein